MSEWHIGHQRLRQSGDTEYDYSLLACEPWAQENLELSSASNL